MKSFSIALLLPAIVFSLSCGTKAGNKAEDNQELKIEFIEKPAEKKIDVIAGGRLFTSFCWYDSIYKPIFYPVYTSEGTEITRGYPLKPREG